MIDVGAEVNARLELARDLNEKLEAFMYHALTPAVLEGMHVAVASRCRAYALAYRGAEPTFAFREDPEDPTNVRMLPTNDAALWIAALWRAQGVV